MDTLYIYIMTAIISIFSFFYYLYTKELLGLVLLVSCSIINGAGTLYEVIHK